MKRFILPLVALTCLVGVSAATTKATQELSPESLGTRRTVWGVLPTYDVPGQFAFARAPKVPVNLSGLKSVTLDVLINADGAVKEAAVASSSGDPATDLSAVAAFKGARYSLKPGDDYPSPFVVQHKITFVPQLAQGTTSMSAYFPPTKPTRKRSGPSISTGTRSTAWGELPTYDGTGQSFAYARGLRLPFVASSPIAVTLDVVVDADGSVKDATVTSGSSDPAFNYAILSRYIGAHYSLQLGPDNPAPYVVQTTLKFEVLFASASDAFGSATRYDSMPPPGSPYSRGPGGGWGP